MLFKKILKPIFHQNPIKVEKGPKNARFREYLMNQDFSGQTTVYNLSHHRIGPSCKIAKKSLEHFLRKTAN